VTVAHLEAWRGHTACSFAFQIFPGGHFFYQRNLAEFLQALGLDVLASIPGPAGEEKPG
jgi:surfactin synthase thioesterase subunit